jgi:hypothetical protein
MVDLANILHSVFTQVSSASFVVPLHLCVFDGNDDSDDDGVIDDNDDDDDDEGNFDDDDE